VANFSASSLASEHRSACLPADLLLRYLLLDLPPLKYWLAPFFKQFQVKLQNAHPVPQMECHEACQEGRLRAFWRV